MQTREVAAVRRLFIDLGPVLTLLVFVVWIIVIFRAMPVPTADFGMFTTVADRLRAGDRLYVDVFENKDPFAHYVLALARIPNPLGAWILHISYLALACVAVVKIARGAGCTRRLAGLVGLVGAPIILTGAAFGPGTSHMVAIALCLWLVALNVTRYAFVSGMLFGLVPFFKIVMMPVALAIVLTDLFFSRVSGSQLRRLLFGFLIALLVCGGVVIGRGELVPWLNALIWNTEYSSALGPDSGPAAVAFHLRSVLIPAVQVILVAAALLAVTSWTLLGRSSPRQGAHRIFRLQVLAGVSFLAGLVIVGASGLWPHHALVFMVPVILCFILFAFSIAQNFSLMSSAAGTAVVLAALLLSGLPAAKLYLDPIVYARSNIGIYFAESSEAALIKSTGAPTTYARVGGGDGPNHALGLSDWKLACPFFTQFVWESTEVLDATLNCLPQAEVVLVEADLKRNTGEPAWDAFVTSVDNLLGRSYDCRIVDGAKICRKTATDAAIG